MLSLLAVLSASSSRRITEIGGLALVGSALPFLRRIGPVLGGLLLAIGFGLLIVAVHFGVNPFHAVKAK